MNAFPHRNIGVSGLPRPRFEAEGFAPFLRASSGCLAEWELNESLALRALGGFFDMPNRLSTIGKGAFWVTPQKTARIRAEYNRPVFLLKSDKLEGILRNQYEFNVTLLPDWRENLWPYLFDYYMRYQQWPLSKRDYSEFFRRILPDIGGRKIKQMPKSGFARRLRARVSALLTQPDTGQLVDGLAAGAGHITHDLLQSDFFAEALAEVDMFSSIAGVPSIVPLAVGYIRDEMCFRIPFEIVQAQRLMIDGLVRVAYQWEYGEIVDTSFVSSSLELYPTSTIVLSPRAKVYARRMQLPLDGGNMKTRETSRNAPLICNGENVKLEVLESSHGSSRISGRRRTAPPADTANLHVRLQGIEA